MFIEVHNNDDRKYTINVEHILTVSPHVMDPKYPRVQAEITLAGGSQFAPSRALVLEDYDEVRRLMGLDWLTCGEMHQGDICDRRLSEDGRCPIHGLVGA